MSVFILLSTYNGQAYLPELLRSLYAQTLKDWVLWIRDDGSSDGTVEQLKVMAHEDPRIQILSDSLGNLGPTQSFGQLITHTQAQSPEYIFFCDQDDSWLPSKLEQALKQFKIAEKNWGDLPCLLHTDLIVTDEKLNEQHTSFVRYQHFNPYRCHFNQLLIQNVVTGCASAFNRSLHQLYRPIPTQALMHDHWMALLASALGKVLFDPIPSLYYRQHGNNQVGAKKWSWRFIQKWIIKGQQGIQANLLSKQMQASALLNLYGAHLSNEQRELLKAFSHLSNSSWIIKRITLFRYHLWFSNLVRNIALLLWI